jgi:hypothetical protein
MRVNNASLDVRHYRPSVSQLPRDEKAVAYVRRCITPGCGKLLTEWEIKRFGKCSSCGGHKISGGPIKLWEWPRLLVLYWIGNWRIHGPFEKEGKRYYRMCWGLKKCTGYI